MTINEELFVKLIALSQEISDEDIKKDFEFVISKVLSEEPAYRELADVANDIRLAVINSKKIGVVFSSQNISTSNLYKVLIKQMELIAKNAKLENDYAGIMKGKVDVNLTIPSDPGSIAISYSESSNPLFNSKATFSVERGVAAC